MKNKLGLLLSIFLAGCIFDTEDPKPNPKPIPANTIVYKSITNVDTVKNFYHTMSISGKVSEKNSSGKIVGGVAAVVCLENSEKCVKTNSKGQYSFRTPKTSSIAARMFQESDTTQTPETIDTTTIPDTTISLDTTIVQDTIVRNDSTIIVDSIQIVETINIDSDSTISDTAIVYKDSKILYEIPVNSWKSILPEKYIVQRNVDVEVSMNRFFNELKSIEAVFWNTDSIAYIIQLENNSNEKNSYSGFIYQPYNDSSFQNNIKVNNIFIRAIDIGDSVFAMTEVLQYSERVGDIEFEQLILGNVLRYPKPNYFRVVEDGQRIKIVPNTQTFPVGELDSMYVRPMFEKDTIVSEIETKMSYKFDSIAVMLLKSNVVDSISVSFISEVDTIVKYKITTIVDSIQIKKGLNIVNLKWIDNYLNGNIFYISFPMNKMSNLRAFIKFKD